MPPEDNNTQTQTPQGDGGTPPPGGQQQTPPAAPVFDTWIKDQPPEVAAMLEEHNRGLKSALETERTQRKQFEKDLREQAKKLDKDSAERKALEEQASRLEAMERQQTFYDAAHAAGVTNLRLAYLAAVDAGLIDDKGRCNFEELRKTHPQLFPPAPKVPAGYAGAGTQTPTPKGGGMNDFIRAAAGRQP